MQNDEIHMLTVQKRQRTKLEEDIRYDAETDKQGCVIKLQRVYLTCPHCGTHALFTPQTGVVEVDEYAPSEKVTVFHYLCKCEACDATVYVGFEEYDDDRDYFFQYSGHYPLAASPIDVYSLPTSVSGPIQEAAKCLNVGAFLASVVMCRRTIEAVLRDKGQARVVNLKQSIEKLTADHTLHESMAHLADLVREVGNIGAHDGQECVTRERAHETYQLSRQLVDILYITPVRVAQHRERFKQESRP